MIVVYKHKHYTTRWTGRYSCTAFRARGNKLPVRLISLQCMSLLMALSGHCHRARACPLSGVKRT